MVLELHNNLLCKNYDKSANSYLYVHKLKLRSGTHMIIPQSGTINRVYL